MLPTRRAGLYRLANAVKEAFYTLQVGLVQCDIGVLNASLCAVSGSDCKQVRARQRFPLDPS